MSASSGPEGLFFTALGVLGRALVAFAAFSLLASAVYLFNDIRDREEDRRHPRKRRRPIASGRLSLPVAAVAAALLAAAALAMGLALGAGFVARSFSGDKKQLVPLIKAAIHYRGFALIDIISPCVTFNNHTASTKSYDYVREHNAALDRVDIVPERDEIQADYAEGTSTEITLHDGSAIQLHKLAPDYDPTDRQAVLPVLERHRQSGEIATGLIYLDPDEVDFHGLIGTTDKPLNAHSHGDLCPGNAALQEINASLR